MKKTSEESLQSKSNLVAESKYKKNGVITKESKGVTLIALIITILVLLILAGVAFSSLMGNDGILEKASKAGEVSRDAEANQEKAIKEYEDEINKWLNPVIWDGDIPVPSGFTYKEGTKSEGYVIKDAFENEFVWIPVDNMSEFKRDDFGIGYSLAETEIEKENGFWDDEETDEYKAMVKSVEKYKGFYIARYEASYNNGLPASKISGKGDASNATQINGELWNWITQIEAITVCNNMYGDSASVVSHLPWGIEWDTMLAWVRDTEFGGDNNKIAVDSRSWGNYDHILELIGLVTSGSINQYRVSNIYDIAGNLAEWTQEKYGTGLERALRGDSYRDTEVYAAAARGKQNGEVDSDWPGFRPALYIK